MDRRGGVHVRVPLEVNCGLFWPTAGVKPAVDLITAVIGYKPCVVLTSLLCGIRLWKCSSLHMYVRSVSRRRADKVHVRCCIFFAGKGCNESIACYGAGLDEKINAELV